MPTGSYCEVCGGVCVASVPSAQRKTIDSELAELKRYRAREPLVQAFIKACDECRRCDVLDEFCSSCADAYAKLSAFKLSEGT